MQHLRCTSVAWLGDFGLNFLAPYSYCFGVAASGHRLLEGLAEKAENFDRHD